MSFCSERLWCWSCVALLALGLSSCSSRPDDVDDKQDGKPTVYVVNYPLRYFAERIGGDDIDVVFPAPGDEDPAFWMPDKKAIAAYQRADLILLNGATYAKWVRRVSLPESRIVQTSAAAENRYLTVKDAITHQHGKKGEHKHAGTAFTIWLDPEIALIQAQSVRDALTKLMPSRGAAFQNRFGALEKDLKSLNADIRNTLSRFGGRPVLFSHPVYQYFERSYKLNARSVHWEPDEMPTEKMWTALKDLLKKHPARWMIWEGKPRKETRKRLKQMGVNSIVFSPCGNVPESGDYLSVMQENLDGLKSIKLD